VIEADRQPGILARMLGSMLQTAREIAGLSYDQAAARLGCEPDWLVRVEAGFAAADPEQVAQEHFRFRRAVRSPAPDEKTDRASVHG
jgi:transcriptional regulator with XRE-family HTH domain